MVTVTETLQKHFTQSQRYWRTVWYSEPSWVSVWWRNVFSSCWNDV